MPRIEGLALYEVGGRRNAVVGPTANVGVRPAEVRETILLVLDTDGRVGASAWSPACGDASAAGLGALVGSDPRDLFTWADDRVAGASECLATSLAAARSLDIALLDMCAQYARVPLWRLLGQEQRARVPAYDCSVRFEDLVDAESSIESVVNAAKRAIESGHRALSVQVGRGRRWMEWPECTQRDIDVCRAVRAMAGTGIAIMVDGGGGYGDYVDDAIDFLVETADCRFAIVQDLVADEWLSQLHSAMLALGLRVPLASGSSLRSRAEFEALFAQAPIEVLLVDVASTGLLEARATAEFAAAHGIRIALCHGSDSRLSVCAAAHLGRVAPALLACQAGDASSDDYDTPGLALVDGAFEMDNSPGLGVAMFDPRTAVGGQGCSS